jgi:hypothetical protein
VMREGCKSSGASEAQGSGAGERRRGEFLTGVSQRGEGVNLTGGAWLIERRGRGGRLEMALTEKENVFPAKKLQFLRKETWKLDIQLFLSLPWYGGPISPCTS